MSGDADLYDRDFVAWTEAQAAELRAAAVARTNLPIDWENLAEEVESLGLRDARELASRLATVIEHLLKLRWSPAEEPRAGWQTTVTRERLEIERLLEQSPSLRQRVPDLLGRAHHSAQKLVAGELLARGETTRAVIARLQADVFSADQVLTDWFPERD